MRHLLALGFIAVGSLSHAQDNAYAKALIQDHTLAVGVMEGFATEGKAEAMYRLGMMHLVQKESYLQDFHTGAMWLMLAEDGGHPLAGRALDYSKEYDVSIKDSPFWWKDVRRRANLCKLEKYKGCDRYP